MLKGHFLSLPKVEIGLDLPYTEGEGGTPAMRACLPTKVPVPAPCSWPSALLAEREIRKPGPRTGTKWRASGLIKGMVRALKRETLTCDQCCLVLCPKGFLLLLGDAWRDDGKLSARHPGLGAGLDALNTTSASPQGRCVCTSFPEKEAPGQLLSTGNPSLSGSKAWLFPGQHIIPPWPGSLQGWTLK